MTDRLSKSEVELLRQEVNELHVLVDEVSRVERITNGTPWHVRLWRGLFGRLIYDGPETCGHCRYWVPPSRRGRWVGNEFLHCFRGDCKLLFGDNDTIETESCHRFTPRRCYKRRVRN